MISLKQIKAARALLDLKQSDLAKKAGISTATLNNIERGAQTDPKVSTMRCIQEALEKEGIVFLNDAFDGIGVQLKPMKALLKPSTVLIVDDNKSDRKLYKSWLAASEKKYRVVEAENARTGFDAFVEHHPDCVILDFMMYGADGFQLLAALRRDHARLPPIIFVSAMHNDVLAQSAGAQGVFCCLDKNKLTQTQFNTSIAAALNQ